MPQVIDMHHVAYCTQQGYRPGIPFPWGLLSVDCGLDAGGYIEMTPIF